jgi:hypothetical protein
MDNDFSVDLDDICATIRSSDVIAVRFVVIGQRLILDFRSTDIDGPMVKVVPAVTSVEERYRSLKRLRPRFPAPEKIVAIWWPRFTRSLDTTGVWKLVLERVSECGHPDAVRDAEKVLRELIVLEEAQQRQAVLGDGFRTLWSAEAATR